MVVPTGPQAQGKPEAMTPPVASGGWAGLNTVLTAPAIADIPILHMRKPELRKVKYVGQSHTVTEPGLNPGQPDPGPCDHSATPGSSADPPALLADPNCLHTGLGAGGKTMRELRATDLTAFRIWKLRANQVETRRDSWEVAAQGSPSPGCSFTSCVTCTCPWTFPLSLFSFVKLE